MKNKSNDERRRISLSINKILTTTMCALLICCEFFCVLFFYFLFSFILICQVQARDLKIDVRCSLLCSHSLTMCIALGVLVVEIVYVYYTMRACNLPMRWYDCSSSICCRGGCFATGCDNDWSLLCNFSYSAFPLLLACFFFFSFLLIQIQPQNIVSTAVSIPLQYRIVLLILLLNG